jgi:hypothetical protein
MRCRGPPRDYDPRPTSIEAQEEIIVRDVRFRPWLTELVDQALPSQITRTEWAETGIGADQGVGEHTWGLVFGSPAGGTVYMQWTHGAPPGGDPSDRDEKIVEGEPPAAVPPAPLSPGGDGRIQMRDLEQWLHSTVINSGCREVAKVEAYSTRPTAERGTHLYGLTLTWHNGGQAYGHLWYTLPSGARRSPDAKYRILESV